MMKSLSNKLFLKKQLYNLQMKERTLILQHLNAFNRILSDMLALEVKLEDGNKALLLLSSLLSSYDHLAITIMYGEETLELKNVRQMLENNEPMKKTYFTEAASELVVKERWWRSQSRGPKKGTNTSIENNDCYNCKLPGHMKKNCTHEEELLQVQGDAKEEGWFRS